MINKILDRFIVDKRYYKFNFALALPIILANAGQALVAIVDNIMVGQLGAIPLAAASLAGIIVTNVMVFGMGVAISLTPTIGPYYANKNYTKCASFFQNAISLNAIIGIGVSLLLVMLSPFLSNMGQDPAVVEIAKPFYILLAISIFPYMIFLAFKQFLEGIGNTRVSMSITIGCNVLNILLNYLLIYGKWGFPEMGPIGAAVSTLVSRTLMPIVFFSYILFKAKYLIFIKMFKREHLRVRKHIQLLKVGLPISGQMVLEMSALSMTTIMMGWISAEALAASQIVLSVLSFMFMITTGMSGAVTILVSHEVGRKNRREIVNYSKAGLQMVTCFMSLAAIMFFFAGGSISTVFTSDPEVIRIASGLFVLAAFLEISDGIQVTALGGLRGLKDVTKPMIYSGLIYICFNIPLAYILGFVFNLGGIGVWSGFIISISIAAVIYTRRLFVMAKKIRF